MGLPAAAWVMIATTLASQIFAVVWWLVRRPVGRLDRLEAAVFGESGVNMKLAKYVTTSMFEERMAAQANATRGISEEGLRREDRILQAIKDQTQFVSSQLSEIKQDIRAQQQRIDQVIANGRD